jgi:DNA-binding transcriptional regulator of glucitol operon
VSTRWFSGRALALHALCLFVVAACLALGWWQLERALSGNTLSWVYTFEWPFFAAYAVFMWWKLLHEEPGARNRRRSPRQPSAEETRVQDEELAEYNRYLADLRASDQSRRN